MDTRQQQLAPRWMTRTLQAAAVYNLAWGFAVISAPLALFRWAGMDDPRYPQIWQCVGMIVGVYGIGYWIAASDPFRHWPIVLVGFLGKIFGPIGFLQAAITEALPWSWGVTIITNDLIWWVPFATILYAAFRANTDTSQGVPSHQLEHAIEQIRSHRNLSLLEISSEKPTLVVFLRHGGCTFCRETLSRLQGVRADIERTGTALAIVHMGTPMQGTLMLEKNGLGNVHRFSDPECVLYRAFELERGRLRHFLAPRVIWRGLQALIRGHAIGRLQGDGFRMPGCFTLVRGQIVEAHRSSTAADTPDHVAMASRASWLWENGRNQRSRQRTLAATG